jgi:hypothetical protein
VTGEERAVIEYRLARAREALAEAKVLLNSGHVNTYVNRLYYACYYAASALLLSEGVATTRHSQLRSLLHQRFVKPGTVSGEMGRHFDRLFDSRQKGDYADFTRFAAEDVAPWLDETRAFVEHVQRLLGVSA